MQTDYARQYEDLWRRHWWWQSRRRFVLSRLHALRRRRELGRILDVGCGNGLFFDDLAAFGQVRGIEPDAGLVAADGPHRARIEVLPFDAAYQPQDGEAFDLVLMLDVLEHLKDDRAAANHVREILKPGGFFLATVPALMMLWSEHDEANLHFRRYTKQTLARLLKDAGFAVESVRYFFGWTIGPMLLRRALSPGGDKRRAASSYRVNVPAGIVNSSMYTLSRVEQTTIGRWGLPLGSSLIAVARKDR